MNLFGTDALINHFTLLFAAAFALGGLVFRKSIANDMLDMRFSFIGCLVASMLTFIILDVMFDNLKILVVGGLLAWLAGGFGLGPVLWDGEASE